MHTSGNQLTVTDVMVTMLTQHNPLTSSTTLNSKYHDISALKDQAGAN